MFRDTEKAWSLICTYYTGIIGKLRILVELAHYTAKIETAMDTLADHQPVDVITAGYNISW